MEIYLFASACVAALALWIYQRQRAYQPVFGPLEVAQDDPIMMEALSLAKASIGQFQRLVTKPHQGAQIKLEFASNSGDSEHLWAEVLEVLDDGEFGVRLLAPPVTHSGQLERLWRCSLDDIEDWFVRDAEGLLHGGYTQRAMLAIAQRDGVQLPSELLKQLGEFG